MSEGDVDEMMIRECFCRFVEELMGLYTKEKQYIL